ncbi:hypothetical protein PHYBLDRAFT_160501 [Phycomyces blakesleeanus NRRL 1555(-)]|uniref:SigF-like NTF2-like domain-containing protein n=1 Tax=Phycomyces blakesleeanus (strain ATCC 8743b / DSM 1359 / FGSC 10004 / NBRC 33097 / NRRL 1555) TaxID=763407 RepID=A0A162ZI09_PHYB8|nr:hypothetical protein PHYBLDRAFT_160501 [Phycomyces blakesleeanus NRRL 1555(-)]OAD66911.1 hypothetical protein PHYBLDRAFT_160501 [Phycomyces blakesleeanus NRRL 1555(-)]|eukprot:XP_018284951.1 hypothetical protein PHYBLDRAFT_160501 [Phycomyces blakesleeanus NRRL 1555(-)]
MCTGITADLYSNDTQKQRQVLRQHFSPNASFVSPLLRTSGIKNIGHVFLVWKTLNRDPPTIEKSCSNQHHCVIFMTQHLRPRLFPLLHLALPVIVTLKFRESESGKLKVEHLEEHWTVEGMCICVFIRTCIEYIICLLEYK